MSRITQAMSPAALAISLLALVVATSASTAYAATRIGTADLKDGAVTSAKVKDGTLLSRDVKDGTLLSRDVKDGTLAAADLSSALRRSLGVRAYAVVDSDEGAGGSPIFLPGRTRGFTAVARTSPGYYCLTLDPRLGVDTTKIVVLVSPEYGYSAGDRMEAYWDVEACPAGQVGVYTEQEGVTSDWVAFSVLVP